MDYAIMGPLCIFPMDTMLILCLLVLILASISCVAASEDVNTTTDNNDFSIATENVAVDEPDEVQKIESSNIDDKNIQTTTDNSSGNVATIGTNSHSLDKPIKATHGISNENHAIIYSSNAATYEANSNGVNGNFSNLQKTLNESKDNDSLNLNCSNYTYNSTDDHDKLSGSEGYKSSLNITDKNLTVYGNGSNNPTGYTIIDGNSSGNYTLIINGSSNVTLYNIKFINSNSE